jgi:membrane protease YdiL (CAAX protease family)
MPPTFELRQAILPPIEPQGRPDIMSLRRRTTAVLEVLGIYLAGQLVTAQLIRFLGVAGVNPLSHFTADVTDAELIDTTRQLVVLLTLQYCGYFLLIIPINWWHRRRGPAAYGLTRGGRSWTMLILAGVATASAAALFALPASSLLLADAVYHLGLGETVPWRQALFDTSWRRWEFWLFTGALSWGFVACIEELFFRGYCQRRLAEDWGDGPAIIGTVFLFVFAHSQYLTLNAYNAATIASLLVLATAFGVVFAWTRSLIPSMVAHAMINVPMTPVWGGLFLVACVTGGVMTRRQTLGVVRRIFSSVSVTACIALGVAGASWAIAAQRVERLQLVAAAMVVLAVGLEVVDRRRVRTAEPPPAIAGSI